MSPTDYRDYEDYKPNIIFYTIINKRGSQITSFHTSELNAWQEARRICRKSQVDLKIMGYGISTTKELQVLA